jgi:hypothetical protein
MAKTLQLRRGDSAYAAAFTGAEGELLVDTQTKTIRVQDGSTIGGTPLARMSDLAEFITAEEVPAGGIAVGPNTVLVQATGATAAENGALLLAGYEAAVALKSVVVSATAFEMRDVYFENGDAFISDLARLALDAVPSVNPEEISPRQFLGLPADAPRYPDSPFPFTISIGGVQYSGLLQVNGDLDRQDLYSASLYFSDFDGAPNDYQNIRFVNNQISPSKLIIGPGEYDCALTIDESYVDVSGLSGNANDTNILQNITVSAGVNVSNLKSSGGFILGVSSGYTFDNCVGGSNSFVATGTYNLGGTFKNCHAGQDSFRTTLAEQYNSSSGGQVTGTFTDCTAGKNSFGGADSYIVPGTFTNCTAGERSFGYYATGRFINCVSTGGYSFGLSDASGTFINCTARAYSFGFEKATGTFINCHGTNESFGSFPSSVISGKFIGCTADFYSFGYQQNTLSGTFLNCFSTGSNNFGGPNSVNGGPITGKLVNCVSEGGNSFGSSVNGGTLINCVTFSGGFPGTQNGGRIINCVSGTTLVNV